MKKTREARTKFWRRNKHGYVWMTPAEAEWRVDPPPSLRQGMHRVASASLSLTLTVFPVQ